MMSVSRTESCLRMPNISSCLRMVLAFSTSSSSANDTSSAGVLDFSSWSLISRMRVVMGMAATGGGNQPIDAEVEGRRGERSGGEARYSGLTQYLGAVLEVSMRWDGVMRRHKRITFLLQGPNCLSRTLVLPSD